MSGSFLSLGDFLSEFYIAIKGGSKERSITMNELLGPLPLDDGNKATASSLLDSANVIKCGGRVDLGGTGTELL